MCCREDDYMKNSLGLLFLLVSIIHIVRAQDQQGFISLDCGLPANELSPYEESFTGLRFSSDEKFIRSGKNGRIRENPQGYAKPYAEIFSRWNKELLQSKR